MSRSRLCLLLTCFAFAGLWASGPSLAAPLGAPSAWTLPSDDDEREIAKYARKLNQLEIKRAKDRQKLEAEYLKLFRRKKSMDLRELQKRMDKILEKREKLEEKYRREILKLEREQARRG